MIYLYHHLGLGDHIICNGMVRYVFKRQKDLSIFCKQHNLNNVKTMYYDIPGLNIIPVIDDFDVEKYIYDNNIYNNIYNNVIKVGFNKIGKYVHENTFDEAFYKIIGIDFTERFNSFHIPRDYVRENNIYEELNPNNEPYIFIHDDSSRGFTMDRGKLPANIKIIENDVKYGLFDMLKIIENAEEVHVMQSSLRDLINSYKMDKPKFFLHNYIRGYDESANTKGLNKFIKID